MFRFRPGTPFFVPSLAFLPLGSTRSRVGLFLAPKMSDDFEDKTADVPATKTPRKRPAPRKAAKAKPAAAAAEPAPVPVEAKVEVQAAPPAEVRREREPQRRESEAAESGPEPIPFFVENTSSEPPGNSKKRRRRKKKGGQGQGQGPQSHGGSPAADQPSPVAETAPPAPVMHAAPRPKLDGDEVAKKAWKIFLSEVGEEGLALIDDHDAREISRRCFRLAEIFLEEAARRHR